MGTRVTSAITPTQRDDLRHLRGHWLVVARVGWLAITLLAAVYFVASVPSMYSRLQQVCAGAGCVSGAFSQEHLRELESMGLTGGFFAGYLVALAILTATVSSVVAGIIFWRKSDDRMALFVALALITFGAILFSDADDMLAAQSRVWLAIIAVLRLIGNCSLMLCIYLFPDGRFVPRWTRLVGIFFVLVSIPIYLAPSSGFSRWLNPIGPWLISGFLVGAVAAQIYRYRRVADHAQRQQTKWVVLGIACMVVSYLAVLLVQPLLDLPTIVLVLATYTVFTLGYLCIPLSLGIAMLRYHLWDIDQLIGRTLLYGALTAGVVAIYVFVVGYLGAIFAQGTPAGGNLAISLIATGLVAVLFQPMRAWLQRGINRLLYGARDEPYAVLAQLGQRLENTLEAGAVLPTIVESLHDALKLPYVAIVLDHGPVATFAASVGSPVPDLLNVPLFYQGTPIGQLLLGPRGPGETFSSADRRLIDGVARQAGVAAHAVRLTADLQRSREQLVLAREEERRRLRNDLHDGLGPQLASLTLKTQTARLRLAHDPLAATLLADLIERTQTAVADIRRVVYALRPPALDELGLLSALRESATQYETGGMAGLQIRLDAPDTLPPLAAAVEVAAYRIAHEALTNVVKHAQARSCILRLAIDDEHDMLCLEVQDDGRGILPDHPIGIGLHSMRERAAELGGTLVIEPVAAGGTLLCARLPIRVEHVAEA